MQCWIIGDDEFDAVGIAISSKLQKLSATQYPLAENLINNILYKAAMNKLNDTCKVVGDGTPVDSCILYRCNT